jgi:cytochrome c biogenesis protein CcmG/thiol:disulfide interchange protein DsbE
VFWSPGCAPCAGELRQLQEVWERHRSRGLAVLGVQEGFITDADVIGFLAANGVTIPNVHDRYGVVGGAFGVMGVPEAHFIDPQWRIQAIDRGDHIGVDRQAGLAIWDPIPPDVPGRRVAELLGGESLAS